MNAPTDVTDIQRPRASAAVAEVRERIRAIETAAGRDPPGARRDHGGDDAARGARGAVSRRRRFRRRRPASRARERYLLGEDADGRFAMYLLALNPGNETKPHDHTTWAVVTAVEGQELNRVYRRTDDGSDPERCTLANWRAR